MKLLMKRLAAPMFALLLATSSSAAYAACDHCDCDCCDEACDCEDCSDCCDDGSCDMGNHA
jgi:hypothetical protein